jgi:hypothetical protein
MSKVMADFNAAKAKGPITLSGAVALLEELVSAGMLAVKPFLSPGADVAGLISTILMEVYRKEIRPLELQHFGAIVSTAVIDPLIHQSIPLLVAAAQKALLHI